MSTQTEFALVKKALDLLDVGKIEIAHNCSRES